MAMAMSASVTESMGEETSGVWMLISFVSADVRSCGNTALHSAPSAREDRKQPHIPEGNPAQTHSL